MLPMQFSPPYVRPNFTMHGPDLQRRMAPIQPRWDLASFVFDTNESRLEAAITSDGAAFLPN